MAKMNMIDSLGEEQINQQFVHAMFLRDDKTYKLVGIYDKAKVQCVCLEDGKPELVDRNFFTGFKVFAYPKLGYRRFGKHSIGYCVKVQSKKRGLATDRVKVNMSPCTQRLQAYGFAREEAGKKYDKGIIIMRPKFDSPDKIKDLLNGKESGVVLNESVIIEPSVVAVDGLFDVWYEQVKVGTLNDADGKYNWLSPKYERLVRQSLAA